MELMEICCATETYIYIIAYTSMMGYILYYFAKPFILKKDKAFIVGAAYVFTMCLVEVVPVMLSNFVAYSIGILSAFFVMCCIDCRNYRQKMYISITFFSLRWLAAYFADTITVKLYDQMVITPYLAGHLVRQLVATIGTDILKLAIIFSVLKFSIGRILKAYTSKRQNMTTKELLMLAVPSVTGMTGYGIMQYYQAYIEISVQEAVSGIYYVLALLHYGISIVTIVVVAVLFQNIKEKQEDKLQNEMISAQIDNMKRHIGQVENLYQDMRGMKHDMTNHILTLERLYTANESGQAKEYARELTTALTNVAVGEIKSGNPITDTILQEWKTEAEKRKIFLESEFHFPTNSNINVFDISVILNNALQNAVENTVGGEAAHISVLSYCRNNAYMIEISNSFAGNLQWDTECGLPITSKGETDSHGYGLSNIRKVAQKYFGDMDIVLQDEKFLLSVMLMMN